MENKAAAVELPAPPGWKKRGASCSSIDHETSGVLIDAYLREFTPRKSSTPRRNAIVFVSPDGDEIKNKSQLDKYLKSHPGGPSAFEFDWGTGDTPRRSSRLLGEKSKATETPESDNPSKKRQRKSSSEKGAKEVVGEREAEVATEKETKASDEPALPDAEDLEVQDVEIASKNLTDGDNIKDEKEKTNDGEIVPEEPPASEDKMEVVQEKEETKDEEKTNDSEIVPEEPPANEDEMEIVKEKEETLDEGNIEKMKNEEAEVKPLDNSEKTLPLNVFEENKIESKAAGTDASSSKATSGSQEEIAEEAPAAADEVNVVEENKPGGADASSHSAELSKATSVSQEEAPDAADPLVQNSNDGKVHENEQIDREIPIEEMNGTEAGVKNSVENNSEQEEATVVDQATSS